MLKIIGTRRLKYQIKWILLIDWVYRYSILMGDRFCNIRNAEGIRPRLATKPFRPINLVSTASASLSNVVPL
jgi:hypothetical protein